MSNGQAATQASEQRSSGATVHTQASSNRHDRHARPTTHPCCAVRRHRLSHTEAACRQNTVQVNMRARQGRSASSKAASVQASKAACSTSSPACTNEDAAYMQATARSVAACMQAPGAPRQQTSNARTARPQMHKAAAVLCMPTVCSLITQGNATSTKQPKQCMLRQPALLSLLLMHRRRAPHALPLHAAALFPMHLLLLLLLLVAAVAAVAAACHAHCSPPHPHAAAGNAPGIGQCSRPRAMLQASRQQHPTQSSARHKHTAGS